MVLIKLLIKHVTCCDIKNTFNIVKEKNTLQLTLKLYPFSLLFTGPTKIGVVLSSKLVDAKCRIQCPVSLIDLAFRSFLWFFSETCVHFLPKQKQKKKIIFSLRSLLKSVLSYVALSYLVNLAYRFKEMHCLNRRFILIDTQIHYDIM